MRAWTDRSHLDWFAEQDDDYREQVGPAPVCAWAGIEAGLTLGWRAYVGDAGACVGLEHAGAPADYKRLYAEFGVAAERTARGECQPFWAGIRQNRRTRVETAHEGRSD